MNKQEIETVLAAGVVQFKYRKVSGTEVRTAFGTRKENLIPPKGMDKVQQMETLIKELKPLFMSPAIVKNLEPAKILDFHNRMDALTGFERTSTQKAPNPDFCNYYDLEAQAWRSFKVEHFIGFIA